MAGYQISLGRVDLMLIEQLWIFTRVYTTTRLSTVKVRSSDRSPFHFGISTVSCWLPRR